MQKNFNQESGSLPTKTPTGRQPLALRSCAISIDGSLIYNLLISQHNMRQTTWAGVFLALLAPFVAGASQVPFHVHSTKEDLWNLGVSPNINNTGHLVFDTVSSFLQHWPNTRYRNGHNIVPGTVPTGTLLYHGRGDSNLPLSPDWTATDPEHSILFCRGSSAKGCWHLTLITSRPLQVLYFDGSSAAKMKDGPMDSQDVVGWGQVSPDRYFDERKRIVDLCNWGKPFQIDGYVRMEMDFEIMLCDFTVGVDVVAMAHLASQGRGPPRLPPPRDVSVEADNSTIPPFAITDFHVLHSGSWHNRYPGDRRIKLDLTRFISFYDTSLVPSLVAKRFGLERWDHRLLGISPEDVDAVMARITDADTAPPNPGSGVDWDTLFKVVVDRYDDRFELLRYVLNTTSDTDVLVTAKKAMAHFRVMLHPYLLYAAVPVPGSADTTWATPVYKFCATSHTEYIRRSAALSALLTASEQLLLNAVEEVNREICRVVVSMWAEGVTAGLDDVLPVEDPIAHDGAVLTRKWKAAVDDLMAWLDWSVWVKCRPECSFEEMCYLPTWPFSRGGPRPPPRDSPDKPPPASPTRAAEPDYLRPQPRCVRRLEPYDF
ncbi:hypothetical protein K438DRAFT_22782 [Mycena galopus ATCC 62051]|nr:hypothetical protein K438DRAFT_22782 [Mycena galopus ATCC 62051]